MVSSGLAESPRQTRGFLIQIKHLARGAASRRPAVAHAPQLDQALRLQVLRRTHQLPAARPAGRRGRPQRLRQVQHHGRGALGARRDRKASELRGESMQDVIFNGSATRKPASRASVELVFDNADAPRRRPVEPVHRDRRQARADARRHSQLLHQQPAGAPARRAGRVPRHRPRARAPTPSSARARSAGSSRSKPEELRLFLEEAAGVSKYKERRRETENRLKDTRENLTRVEDILRELNANLDKLEKQAEVAQQLPRAAGRGHAASSTSCGS